MQDRGNWVEQLPPHEQERARWLLAALERLGCADPDSWARSEIKEDIPQLARFRILRMLWPQLIDDRSTITAIPAGARAVAAGASEDDLTQLARYVAYDTVFTMLYRFTDEDPVGDVLSGGGYPHSALVEIGPDGEPTGRRLGLLHEELLGLDPSGREGQDLWS